MKLLLIFHPAVTVPLDVDISPSLAKLVADPKKVQEITKNIKDLVKLLAYILIGNGGSEPNNRLLWRFPNQDQMVRDLINCVFN